MKKMIALTVGAMCLAGCYNEPVTYDDYPEKSIYFPYQYPVRTLSLGNDVVDNSLDRQHKFNIGVVVGGYYKTNKQNWKVGFAVDESIVGDNLYNANGDLLKVLPREFYTLEPESSVTIPEGSFSGLIQVHLDDAFFETPEAVKGNYVIPIVITSVQDPAELITGKAKEGVENPNIHVATDWDVLPMHYTLFAVKYVNKFHGSWLRRGERIVRNEVGEIIATDTYHKEYVEWDEVVSLKTSSMSSFTTTMNISDEEWTLEVEADETDNLTVKSASGSATVISEGFGRFKEGGDSWGGTPENPTKRDAIYLDYFYERADGSRCEVLDTLVFRDRSIVIETARPIVK
ncbi:MAG: BT_3987 domain-containing protein [Candidatus Cryptobacteroides sp.]